MNRKPGRDHGLDQGSTVLLHVREHQIGTKRLHRADVEPLRPANRRDDIDVSRGLHAVVGPANQPFQTDELFRRVREEIGEQAGSRGYQESSAEVVEVKDPVDDARVLDVWHEVTYRKPLDELDDAVSEVRWALDLEKYVRP